jgi:hypothetical protein
MLAQDIVCVYQSCKGKSLKQKFIALCFKLGIAVKLQQRENFACDCLISLMSLKTRYDLNVAFHELAHIILNHKENSIANEIEADLLSDHIIDLLYGDGKSYLFGGRIYNANLYSGTYSRSELFAFTNHHRIPIDDEIIEYIKVFAKMDFSS